MTTAIDPAGRDPQTGDLLNPVRVDVYLAGVILPRFVYCRDWASARQFLASAEFEQIADRVRQVAITNREAP
ncbi:hypothetical protein [Streptomyces sp. RPT161]|uniref:hypothetical protein n=1 Tax=Streptomyces sp. RPT161 TaxID=3015993 RepID=UPI0022B8A0EB|nr:hypothetical protein [Streptomyces sp. RPT161]